MKRTEGSISAKDSERNGVETGDELEMIAILREDVEAEVEGGGIYDQVFKRDSDDLRSLFAFDPAGGFGDFLNYRRNGDVVEYRGRERPSRRLVRSSPVAKNPVGQLDNADR